jgi:hypothetical protein
MGQENGKGGPLPYTGERRPAESPEMVELRAKNRALLDAVEAYAVRGEPPEAIKEAYAAYAAIAERLSARAGLTQKLRETPLASANPQILEKALETAREAREVARKAPPGEAVTWAALGFTFVFGEERTETLEKTGFVRLTATPVTPKRGVDAAETVYLGDVARKVGCPADALHDGITGPIAAEVEMPDGKRPSVVFSFRWAEGAAS